MPKTKKHITISPKGRITLSNTFIKHLDLQCHSFFTIKIVNQKPYLFVIENPDHTETLRFLSLRKFGDCVVNSIQIRKELEVCAPNKQKIILTPLTKDPYLSEKIKFFPLQIAYE